jgi:ribosomal-protein-alanine N-acetyltransferase
VSRVEIRTPALADQDEFIARMKASRAVHAPWIRMPTTADAYRVYIERARAENVAMYLAFRRSDQALVGFLNLSEIIRGKLQQAFIGYGGVAGLGGRGYMTEAMDLVLREAFTVLKLHRVEANIQPGNTASRALAERCGFVREGFSPSYLKVGGRWRDHERWAIRAELWRTARSRRATFC